MTGTIDYTYAVPDRCATYHLEIRYSLGDGFSGSYLDPPQEREVTIDGATCTSVDETFGDVILSRNLSEHDAAVIGKWFLDEHDGDEYVQEELATLILEKHEAVRM